MIRRPLLPVLSLLSLFIFSSSAAFGAPASAFAGTVTRPRRSILTAGPSRMPTS